MFVCHMPRHCFANLLTHQVFRLCPHLTDEGGGWLPGAMELPKGPLQRRDMD